MKLWLVMRFENMPISGSIPKASTRSRQICDLLVLVVCLIAVAIGSFSARAGDAQSSRTTQLIMVEAPGCRFCALWHEEIGPAYAQSAEGRFAPLVRVGRDSALLSALKPVTFTPTFIIMQNGVETGRLAGYPGRDYFWDELVELLTPLGFASSTVGQK